MVKWPSAVKVSPIRNAGSILTVAISIRPWAIVVLRSWCSVLKVLLITRLMTVTQAERNTQRFVHWLFNSIPDYRNI